jgi:hypothetical protein
VITGQVYDQNKQSFGFEGFVEGSQKRITGNKTNYPNDLYITDPITGRLLHVSVDYNVVEKNSKMREINFLN